MHYYRAVVRRILKKLSRGVVLTRHLPDEFGHTPILVSPESALRYWRRDLGKVDPFLLSMARELVRPEMTVWDIGANVGLFSFAAAALGARVLAVEPDPWLAHLLQRSVLLNRLPVTVLPSAISDAVGVSPLYHSEEGRASNSLIGKGLAQMVITITLDWMLQHFPPPQVLKIDVEGWECAVLKGASKVLGLRPVILCEVTQSHDTVGRLLREAGYTLYGARETERCPLQQPWCDTLALPLSPS
jgi:FkbM family methyltransferase